jgi:glycine cleavage system H lipoate-binding protein
MACPFLRESQVRYCRSTPVRKLIPLAQGGTQEKCSSPAFTTCQIYRSQAFAPPSEGECPFLREALMQYCGAAPVTCLVPYSESLNSRCGTASYRYCDLYLSMAHPAPANDEIDDLALPGWLRYTSNHMWLDATDDGICHAGIDGFLARAMGPLERLSYVWQKGRHYPTAVLTAAGQDFEVVFPNPMILTACNLYLRANPRRLNTSPYTAGWLFEGQALPETSKDLLSGPDAQRWMEREQLRMNEFLQEPTGEGPVYAADGGQFVPDLARRLAPDRLRTMFHEFFSQQASGDKL